MEKEQGDTPTLSGARGEGQSTRPSENANPSYSVMMPLLLMHITSLKEKLQSEFLCNYESMPPFQKILGCSGNWKEQNYAWRNPRDGSRLNDPQAGNDLQV